MKQLTFASASYSAKKKITKREAFLAEMDQVVSWERLLKVIEPHYPKTSKGAGRPPMPLAVMLRIYCLQLWLSLSDPAMEEALYDVECMGMEDENLAVSATGDRNCLIFQMFPSVLS